MIEMNKDKITPELSQFLNEQMPEGSMAIVAPIQDLVDIGLALQAAKALFVKTGVGTTPCGLTLKKVVRLEEMIIGCLAGPGSSSEAGMARVKSVDGTRAPAGMKLGATGNYPGGKLTEEDEGELRMAMRAVPEKGIVALDFGKNVSWLGLDKDVALKFSDSLRREAGKLP